MQNGAVSSDLFFSRGFTLYEYNEFKPQLPVSRHWQPLLKTQHSLSFYQVLGVLPMPRIREIRKAI